ETSRVAVRGGVTPGVRRARTAAQIGAAPDEPGARIAGLQPDHSQLPVFRGDRRVLSLACGTDAEADANGGIRVGDRLLHQSDVARGSGRGVAQGSRVGKAVRRAAFGRT